ncbi:ABC transporter permease [Anaeromicropila populeti]|uniref:Nucleoside ABC transporter membrane protein n=1 Tax=Anaeromicropila populeti TaxID=37658 RepID=A0A1I6I8F7_9FIRM|nr:ABC transporter permease [Anaeromicropila populeti]SFR63012.1 nucleoside ABC transporter membrane protein [Anaeromicropila populeti]
MDRLNKILKKQITATFIAIFFGFLVATVILAVAGYNPFEAFAVLFKGIFSRPKYMANVIIKATPIILTGVSVAFAFKVGLFNIGAEGQFIIGTVAAAMAGILLDLPAVLQFPLLILIGMAAGALYGAIIGFLKAKYGIHEVITGIMLNWIAFYFCNYIVNTHTFHQDNSTGSKNIREAGFDIIYNWKKSAGGKSFLKENPTLMEIIGKTDLNIGIIFAIAAAIIITIVLNKTTKGFQLRAVGFNKDAAEFAGINIKKNMIHAMLIAGALSGLAGALMVTGISHKLSTLGTFENYGFNGLSISLIATNSPIGCIFAGLLFAGLLYGGGSIQSEIGAPSEIINIMIGTIVFFVALSRFIPVLVDKYGRRGGKHVK